MKYVLVVISFVFLQTSYAQVDSSIFNRITKELSFFKPDTTTPPDDNYTRKVKQLSDLRGGFNIHEAIQFKIQEELKEKKISQQEAKNINDYFTTGIGRLHLDNAVNHIYRAHFSYKEMKKLVKFYRTSAGQKMATDFPFIMLKTLAAAEAVKKNLTSSTNN